MTFCCREDDSVWLAPTFGEGDSAENADGTLTVSAPQQGTLVSFSVEVGDEVTEGQPMCIMNAMKMEHVVQSPTSGTVAAIEVDENETVQRGHSLFRIQKGEVSAAQLEQQEIALDR
jgi:biotin carboxyl carrier protein